MAARRAEATTIRVGGRINETPDDTNSGRPVGVSADVGALGTIPCRDLDDMPAALEALLPGR